jgi:hypothetical protein
MTRPIRFRAMRRILLSSTVAALLICAAPAGAITYGVPDGDGHPEVGALLAQQT